MNGRELAMIRFEWHLGRVLIAGATVSAAALLAGLLWYLIAPDSPPASWLLAAGLVILMATPMLRVMLSIVEYMRMGDWFFVATTLAVLAELTVTVVYALRRH
jgi:uncharacterized membrane protein